jgi:DNA/RNA-binding domain of Phe-tRNA-synthetase-like protein
VTVELSISDGKVASVLKEEFPGLAIRYSVVEAQPRRSPSGVKEQLRYLSNRFYGHRALNLRREPIASAYRVFYRHIGLDPDESRTPIEAASMERLRAGGFKSHGLVEDAITIGTVETGVAMRALDADRISGRLGLRIAEPEERLGGSKQGLRLPDGALVIADEEVPVGLIFGETSPAHDVTRDTQRVAVCAIQVQGVPDISVEEAIWSCANALRGGGPSKIS